MKLSVNEAKLTGLWARNCANIQLLLILKFAFGPEKFPGLSRNRPLESNASRPLMHSHQYERYKGVCQLASKDSFWIQSFCLFSITHRLDFRHSLSRGRSAGSFPKQRLVIEGRLDFVNFKFTARPKVNSSSRFSRLELTITLITILVYQVMSKSAYEFENKATPGPPLMVCSLGFIYDKENQQDSSLLCLKIVFDKQPDDSAVCLSQSVTSKTHWICVLTIAY